MVTMVIFSVSVSLTFGLKSLHLNSELNIIYVQYNIHVHVIRSSASQV